VETREGRTQRSDREEDAEGMENKIQVSYYVSAAERRVAVGGQHPLGRERLATKHAEEEKEKNSIETLRNRGGERRSCSQATTRQGNQ